MYLKSLEVHGFKSFANKLVFEFHNGITAIVGPNGSGKSNVADAVRWVLGEQSAKQLRGAKMEDVIFSGTQLRKPQGFAYVAITISNEDHQLKVPYEEVKIARRVYRSGESEYLLNGASCRLRDIQELLFDTGIGKEGYSIIGQGQIDKILSGKPEERRELFDEAAGIVKFKKRKTIAEKNLEEEEQNLVRIEDILSELEKQVEPLEQQSQKAREYLGYRDELRNLDIHVFLQDYKESQQQLEELQNKESIAKRDLEKAQGDFEKAKTEYVALEEQLEKHTQNLEECKETLVSNRVKYNQQEGDIKVLKEQINALRQSETYYREQLQGYALRISSLQQEKDSFVDKEAILKQQLQSIEQRQQSLEEAHQKLQQAASELEKTIAHHNQQRMEAQDANTDVASMEERIQTLLEQNNIKKAQLTKRILENKAQASQMQETITAQQQILDEVNEQIHGLDAAREELFLSQEKLNQTRQQCQKEQKEVQQKYHMAHSRLHALQSMTERYEGFGQSIKRVMEQKNNHPGIIGVVADIIRVNKQYEIAVETALGGSIQNIVTDHEQTAKDMITFLKKNKYGRATFLPLTNIQGRKPSRPEHIMAEPGVIGMASALVQTEERFQGLVEHLLGRFVVVDHIDHAIALGKKYHHTLRMVTIEGELLNPGGSMSGGAFKNNHNLLGRRREMEELENSVVAHQESMKHLAEQMQEFNKQWEEIASKIDTNGKLRQELVLQQNTAKLKKDRADHDMEQNQEVFRRIQYENREMEQEKQSLQQQLKEIHQQRKEAEDQNQLYAKKIASCNALLEENRQEERKLSDEEADARMEQGNLQQQIQFQQENIARVEKEINNTMQEEEEAKANNRQADGKVREKEEQIKQLEHEREQLEIQIETLSRMVTEKTETKEQLQETQKSFLEKRENLSQWMNALDKECFRLQNGKEKVQEKMDTYTNYMWEQYELTYTSAEQLQVSIEMTLEQMRKRIKELKDAIKALGDVNVNAIEQYKELMERYELLHGQHDDLIEAAEVLRGVIRDLDEEMRKQFQEQFAEIRTRFDKVFKELFGGGRGTLELTEDEDVLEAGIRIVAQPPGKKLQNMMQMSGGEKALTAIALLFAIQSLKPSPFCLLDEIEAALDDSNVGRYANYLHKLTQNTQFIVITHRRGTMNAADILYGITMQEKGVSTLVSVSLLDEKDIAN